MSFLPYRLFAPTRLRAATVARSRAKWIQVPPSARNPMLRISSPGLSVPDTLPLGHYQNPASLWTARKHRSALLVRSCAKWVPMLSSKWQDLRIQPSREVGWQRSSFPNVIWSSDSDLI